MSGNSIGQIQSSLLDVVAGDEPDEYFVLGNWNADPTDPEGISCCVSAVKPTSTGLHSTVLYRANAWVTALYRGSSRSYLLGTSDGELIRVSENTRETYVTGVNGIQSIAGTSDKNCWITHNKGISHWDGHRISNTMAAPTMHGIHFLNENFGVAVGKGGTVLSFAGDRWRSVDSVPSNTRLIDVFCASSNEIYVCGWQGFLYRWDGKEQWSKIEAVGESGNISTSILSVIQYKGKVYACCRNAGLFEINGSQARKVAEVFSDRASVINEKLIITGLNTFSLFDGNFWENLVIDLP